MKAFNYTINDKLGLHARPAGGLMQIALKYKSRVTVTKGERTVEAVRLIAIMGLVAKKDDVIIIAADGPDEENALAELETYCRENL